MASVPPDRTNNALLRGLFGTFQAGAAQRQDTASIWTSLRTAAGTWLFQAQGAPQPYDAAALEEAGRRVLSAAGVNAANVSTFRGIAGAWLGAKDRLHAQDTDSQILAGSIFTPPWAKTDTPAVPSRYAIRTQWLIEPTEGEAFTTWRRDELTSPLTTIDDALADAEPEPDTESGRMILSAAAPATLLDYAIEQL